MSDETVEFVIQGAQEIWTAVIRLKGVLQVGVWVGVCDGETNA